MIDDVIAKINTHYKKETIIRASDGEEGLSLKRIPLAVPVLDLGLGGGIPKSRIIQFIGQPSTGKSLLALKVAARFQKYCRVCGQLWENDDIFTGEEKEPSCKCKEFFPMEVVWADVEHSFTNDWAKKQDILLNNCHVVQPEYAEQTIDVVEAVIRSKECDLIVIDSVAAMTPSVEIENSAQKEQMGISARLMNKAMRKWTSGLCSVGINTIKGKPTIILINQIRHKIGVTFGSPETEPGGLGMGFFSSIRVKFKRIEKIIRKISIQGQKEKEDLIIGQTIGFNTEKNKTFAPFRSGKFDFYFSDYQEDNIFAGDIDIGKQIFALGRKHGFIKVNGSWFSIGDQNIGQGKDNAAQNLLKNPDICYEIWEYACMKELGRRIDV